MSTLLGSLVIYEDARDAIKLWGRQVASTAPTNDDILAWVAATSKWTPVDIDTLITGTYVDVTGDTMTGDLLMDDSDINPLTDGEGSLGLTGTRWGDGFFDALDATEITGTLQTASQTNITGVGTLGTGTWNADVILSTYGGTGLSSYTAGDLVYYAASTALSKLGIGGTGTILRSTGSAPSWTTTTFPATQAQGDILYASAANIVGGLTIGAANTVLVSNGTIPGWATSLALAGTLSADGAVTLGSAADDNITINGTVVTNLIFTDGSYDIGASGATRPRTGFFETSLVAPIFVGVHDGAVGTGAATPAAASVTDLTVSGTMDFTGKTTWTGAGTGDDMVGFKVALDTHDRLLIEANGDLSWGPGNAAQQIKLRWDAANSWSLDVDGSPQIGGELSNFAIYMQTFPGGDGTLDLGASGSKWKDFFAVTGTYSGTVGANLFDGPIGTGAAIPAAGSFTTVDASGNMVVLGTGPHAIGGAPVGYNRFNLIGTFTSDGASTQAQLLNVGGILVGAGGDTSRLCGTLYNASIVTQNAAEVVGVVAQLYLNEPAITKNVTAITNAATLWVAGAPTEGNANWAAYFNGAVRSTGDFDVNAKFNVTAATGALQMDGALDLDGDLNHDGSNVGFYGTAPAAQPAAYTQTYSTADRTFSAYTPDDESGAYTGIDNAQGGTPYAQLTDLNLLRAAYENLRAFAEDIGGLVNSLIDDHQILGLCAA